jgi:triphosphoribosyl-dephospho-CoA synthase
VLARRTAPRTAQVHALADSAAAAVARLARQALIAEAELTPKPGLVDRRGSGAHTDLSLELMRRSAAAIEPHFYRMAAVCRGASPAQSLRETLALIGRQAEHAMLAATGGSNAHKGAIWTLGLLASAYAMHKVADFTARNLCAPGITASSIAATAGAIASFRDRAIPRLVSHGDSVAKRYGVAGARGEAVRGFPHVVAVALPMLRRRRREGATEEVARLDALLAVMSQLDDTCLLYRGGEQALEAAKRGALAVQSAGGAGTAPGMEALHRLERRLLDLQASPGGSADLLAASLFLDAAESGQSEVRPDRGLPEEDSHGAH